MKKDLILIGNKPNIIDISKEVDSYDFVMRVNRMQNYGLSGTKIDGLYLCLSFEYLSLLDEHSHELTLKADKIFIEPRHEYFLEMHLNEICTKEQYDNHGLVYFSNEGFERVIPNRRYDQVPTSTFKLLDYLLNTEYWMDNYNITVSGVDIEGRGELLSNGDAWRSTTHKDVGDAEGAYVLKNVEDGRLKLRPC